MLKNINDLFFEQLRISLGTQQNFSCFPTDEEWIALFDLSVKQSLSGVMMCGFEKTLENDVPKKPSVLFEWIGVQQKIIAQNTLQNRRAKELYEIFKEGGYKSCVLKGQGTATYYEKPELRQCGDIDLWVEGDREDIVEYEQHGHERAEYDFDVLNRLSRDLTDRHGKGFSRGSVFYMRKLYLTYPKVQTVSELLTWSHYVELLKIDDPMERSFYEKERRMNTGVSGN